ncbi:MAG TPA: hypothetical protein DCE56_06895 [Cyanobacteria bacterium UBA8553]|nr:hypothetical protein [Cyanobacteria bacterium UBA8553]HAJ63026.1 hypothetical protein [Cyanobacteria bacterium UBA8543]
MNLNPSIINPEIEPWTNTIGLGLEAHSQAEQFQRHHGDPLKAKQVYLNTLAVYAVNVYLQRQDLETDLENSASWDSVMQVLMDVADLEVKNRGKLECRPVLTDAEAVCIPAEVWGQRIGYIAVQLSESLREAKLLGFVEKVERPELPLSQLRSLQQLPGYLNKIRPLVNLSQWFEDIFEAGWKAVESLIDIESTKLADNFRSLELGTEPTELAYSFRSLELGIQPTVELAVNDKDPDVRRCKLVELETPGQSVALIVALTKELDQEIDISVEVQPAKGQLYLPSNLQLMMFDEDGETIIDAYASSDNKTIKLKLSGEPGDRFSVKVTVGDVSVTEYFIV